MELSAQAASSYRKNFEKAPNTCVIEADVKQVLLAIANELGLVVSCSETDLQLGASYQLQAAFKRLLKLLKHDRLGLLLSGTPCQVSTPYDS